MNKVTKEEVLSDAKALKITLTDEEVDIFTKEINEFMELRPNMDLSSVEPLFYTNEDHVNVFSTLSEELVEVEDLLSNVKDREGNYIKVPKVL